MDVDGEIGGNDQTFNMLAGRDLLRKLKGKEKIVITTRLLEDPATGKKVMNKSEGQYISLNDSASEIFGKTMAIPDSAIVPLLSFATELPDSEVDEAKRRLGSGENPKNLKGELAFELVRMYHGEKEAEKAKGEFQRIFSEGQLPKEIEEIPNGQTILQTIIMARFAPSKSEAKRLIEQKAVSVNDKVVESWDFETKKGDIIKVGPRKFGRVK
jgi:tyrosyl-tRNA synthetase